MNRVIIDIGLIRYILDSKYIVISVISFMQFHELWDYKYWTYKMHFRFNKVNHVGSMNRVIINIVILIYSSTRFMSPRDFEFWSYKINFIFKI